MKRPTVIRRFFSWASRLRIQETPEIVPRRMWTLWSTVSRYSFEAMKRIGVLVVLRAAADRAPNLEVLYYAGLLMFAAPLLAWSERWRIVVLQDDKPDEATPHALVNLLWATLVAVGLFVLNMEVLVLVDALVPRK